MPHWSIPARTAGLCLACTRKIRKRDSKIAPSDRNDREDIHGPALYAGSKPK
jgi:hypothetical protein